MFNVNRVEIIGNLGRDPEIRTAQSGKSFATLSVATTERWTSNGQPVERTDWHRITVLSQGLVTTDVVVGNIGEFPILSAKRADATTAPAEDADAPAPEAPTTQPTWKGDDVPF